MLKYPSESKFLKQFKGKNFNKINKYENFKASTTSNIYLKLISSLDYKRISEKKIKMLRLNLVRNLRRIVLTRKFLFPDVPVTKKPSEIRMGKGKGSFDRWICKIPSGRIIIKIIINNRKKGLLAINTLKKIQKKLPIRTNLFLQKGSILRRTLSV